MLASKVTETEATLICMYYFYRPRYSGKYLGVHLSEWERQNLCETNQCEAQLYLYAKMCEKMEKEDYHFYSYEQLAILFDRSKATIHAVIQNHKDRVKPLLDADRIEARRMAMKELVEEEKARLRESEGNN